MMAPKLIAGLFRLPVKCPVLAKAANAIWASIQCLDDGVPNAHSADVQTRFNNGGITIS
jgi:hypothetical protein